ncbi:hypothetical protein D3C75_793280 [compost metagenome]
MNIYHFMYEGQVGEWCEGKHFDINLNIGLRSMSHVRFNKDYNYDENSTNMIYANDINVVIDMLLRD